MDEDSRIQALVKYGLGLLGLGAVVAAFAVPGIGIWIALIIVLLGLLLFGGYYLWYRRRARRNREQFSSAIEVQVSAAPRSISDPKKRAELDKVREKFQSGFAEFKSRGKDIYKLPWYVIIGESGSGKTEAIRHSEIDFPPGLNKEHQGSGGTVNMDWWFTNRGIILDTAGSMVFPEAGASDSSQSWQEFLRLLKKTRPGCPINGLFLVLSIESIIRDSADRISQKASRLAQQLDVIQRTLDVRFPVFLLITKCDLLTGFREFFDSIEDPLLQHQIFGWSNPDPLDAPFRPDLVEQHLDSMANRIRRRRMGLLRESSAAGRIGDTSHFFASNYQLGRGMAQPRRIDEVDSLFAFPESIMRLAPRLRRYLETIFVAGEWSAKPVFLRGIYFTSSMREGKALDEAIAFATGLSLDQLPEERTWDKNRAYFLRDLFHEKVFRESGLVTRATNTLTLLRQRQMAIFGSAGAALLLLLGFAGFAYYNLKKNILVEKDMWQAGAAGWKGGEWTNSIVTLGSAPNVLHCSYGGTNLVSVGSSNLTLIDYHTQLRNIAEKPLSVGFIFAPLKWLNVGNVKTRGPDQRLLFEGSVLRPLVWRTRDKMLDPRNVPADDNALARHRVALLALIQLEAENVSHNGNPDPVKSDKYLRALISYLTDQDWRPEAGRSDVGLARFSALFSKTFGQGDWPPAGLSASASVTQAIMEGLRKYQEASISAQTNIDVQVALLNELSEKLRDYHTNELAWLKMAGAGTADPCATLRQTLIPRYADASTALVRQRGPLTALLDRYHALESSASNASVAALSPPIELLMAPLAPAERTRGLFKQIQDHVGSLAGSAGKRVSEAYAPRLDALQNMDRNCMLRSPGSELPAFQLRWSLFTNACALSSTPIAPAESDFGDGWKHYKELNEKVNLFRAGLTNYSGPLAFDTSNACYQIAANAEQKLKTDFVSGYVALASSNLSETAAQPIRNTNQITAARTLFSRLTTDLDACGSLGAAERGKLMPVRGALTNTIGAFLKAIDTYLADQIAFPVRCGATKKLNKTELALQKPLLQQFQTELANPIWSNCAGGPDEVKRLLDKTTAYGAVVKGLLPGTPADPVAKFKVSFLPNEVKGGGSEDALMRKYRHANISTGSQEPDEKDDKDITSIRDQPIPLGEVTADQPITFLMRYSSLSASTQRAAWPLAVLVRNKEAASTDGKIWRINFKTGDDLAGAVFQFELLGDASLPTQNDWPN